MGGVPFPALAASQDDRRLEHSPPQHGCGESGGRCATTQERETYRDTAQRTHQGHGYPALPRCHWLRLLYHHRLPSSCGVKESGGGAIFLVSIALERDRALRMIAA